MNWKLILLTLAATAAAVAVGEGLCAALGLAMNDSDPLALAGAALLSGAVALICWLGARRMSERLTGSREVVFAVVVAWLAASALGGLPYLLAGTFSSPIDAVFEGMSGFTTTGATVIADIEAQPRDLLLWRSATQWLGGVGIVVLLVAVAPALGAMAQRIFLAETTKASSERLRPRISENAKLLLGIYGALSLAAALAYLLVGLSPYDAVAHAMTAISTGGFSPYTASIAAFDSLAVELVTIAVMIAGGVNFAVYWRLATRRPVGPARNEFGVFVAIMAAASLVIALTLLGSYAAPEALRHATFAVSSIITTTGFVTVDFDSWDPLAKAILLGLMFVGACAGSTAGGMKVLRVVLLAKIAVAEVGKQIEPQRVRSLRFGKVYPPSARETLLAFFFVYVMTFVASTMLLAALGSDLTTASSATAATLNVVGPGLAEVGASESFAAIPPAGRVLLTMTMLAGRLEVLAVLALLLPAFWRGRFLSARAD